MATVEQPNSESLAQENEKLRRFNDSRMGVVRYLAEHRPISETLLAVCDLVERTLPGAECFVLHGAPEAGFDMVSTSEVPAALSSVVEQRIRDALDGPPTGTFEDRRFDVTDPTRPDTHTVRCMPIFGLGPRPLGGLGVTHAWSNGSERAEAVFLHAARLVQIAMEQHRASQNFAVTIAAERERIANGLHDDPIQAITVVSLMLQRLAGRVAPEQREAVDEVRRRTDDAINRLRRMLFELHPAVLEDEGLVVAIEVYLEETMDPLGIAWDLDDRLDEVCTGPIATLVYRLAHESLANVVAHSKASKVGVVVRPDHDGINVTITDDGEGFDPSEIAPYRPGHLGLANLRYLANRTAGRFDIESAPGEGCTVDIWIPLDHPAPRA